MDLLQYPGIPALNALPKEQRLDRFRATHRWLMAHDGDYQRRNRRFWTGMGLGALAFMLTVGALGWAVTHGSLSQEQLRGICIGLSLTIGPGVGLVSQRYDRFRRTAIQHALATGAGYHSSH